MTRIKDPKQVANIIRHILLILISSLRVCFMAGRRGWRLLLALWGMKGRFVRKLRGSVGTDEDCPPVNELLQVKTSLDGPFAVLPLSTPQTAVASTFLLCYTVAKGNRD
ncbi:hypothetical protein PAMP_014770 [Pampus punctatissimus]